jgi:hypothetical protein
VSPRRQARRARCRRKTPVAQCLAELVRYRVTEFLNVRSVNAELCRPRLDHNAENGQLAAVKLRRLPTLERIPKLRVERALGRLAAFRGRSWDSTDEFRRAVLAQDVDLVADANGQHTRWVPQAGRPLTSHRRLLPPTHSPPRLAQRLVVGRPEALMIGV